MRQKSRQKSPADNEAALFLKQTLAPHKTTLMLAWGLELLSVLVLIVFAFEVSGFFDELLTEKPHSYDHNALILKSLPIIGGCLLLRLFLMSIKESILASVGVKMAVSVRTLALQSIGKLNLARRQFGADGALASYVIKEPDELLGYAKFYVQKFTAMTTPLLIAVVVGFFSRWSAVILLATAPFLLFFMVLIGIKTAKKSQQQMTALAQMSGRFLDWLRGMNTLTRLGAVAVASDDIEKASQVYKNRTMSVLKVAFLNSTVLEFFSALCIALVAIYLGFGLLGLLSWAESQIDYRLALLVLLLVPEFYLPLRRLGVEYHAKSAAFAAAKVLAPILKTANQTIKPVVQLPSNADIIFDDVSVHSENRLRLSSVNLHIKHGQRWAIVGASGSGKSTLFEVLLGVCAYQGGVKIGDWERKDGQFEKGQIGYLPQTFALLPMSIADNLRLAKSDASDDEIIQILIQVGLSELLALPNGINTVLSERGGGLSGGQAQRLGIAQLLLQNAQIWLLDEPTEHLDSQTKESIHALLHKFSEHKTVLWATHDTPALWLDGVYSLEGAKDAS